MPINLSRSALVVASLAFSSVAMAEDVRITCTGTVASVANGGLTAQPFAGAAVGDAVTYTIDVEVKHPASAASYNTLYQVNWPTSSATLGGASDGFAPALQETLTEFTMWNGGNGVDAGTDQFIFQGGLASDSSTFVQLYLTDNQGIALSTWDLRELVGTSLPIQGWSSTRFRMWESQGTQGALEFTLNSVVIDAAPGGLLGTPYCAAVPNTTGRTGTLTAYGLSTPGDNDLTLTALELPTSRFGYFLASPVQGFVPAAGGSQGNLCLSGNISRLKDEIQQSDSFGKIAVALELGSFPGPTGTIAVQSGQTWNFQLWHRDFSPALGATSNFTQALSVTFQ